MTTTISGAKIVLPANSLSNADLATNADIATSKIAQRVLAEYPLPLTSGRTWDNMAVNLPLTPATDDLGLLTGTLGTDWLTIESGDLKAAGATSRIVAFEWPVPPHYDDGATIQCRIRAGMETNVADASATIDLVVWKPNGEGLISGADLCTTAAQSHNSLTLANLDFVLDAANIDPGDLLQLTITMAINDAATGTAVTGVITDVRMMLDTRG